MAISFWECPIYIKPITLPTIPGIGGGTGGGAGGGTISGTPNACAAIAVAEAQKQIGKPYVWAAAGPNSFDCSGLMLYAYKKAGVSLPHYSGDQYSGQPKVSKGSELPGDLVFFGSPIHHVGMVIGGGKMIEAPYTGAYVRISSYGRSDLAGFSRPKCKLAATPTTTTSVGGGSGTAKPANTISKGSGWSLKNGTDYSSVAYASGSSDKGTYKHPTNGFTFRKCGTAVGVVNALISQRTVEMIAAAKADGVSLSGSGFRSYETQQGIYAGCSPNCGGKVAKPGNSNHERGLAIDFTYKGSLVSKGDPVYKWLKKNGATYGFINYPAEDWHWSMSGG